MPYLMFTGQHINYSILGVRIRVPTHYYSVAMSKGGVVRQQSYHHVYEKHRACQDSDRTFPSLTYLLRTSCTALSPPTELAAFSTCRSTLGCMASSSSTKPLGVEGTRGFPVRRWTASQRWSVRWDRPIFPCALAISAKVSKASDDLRSTDLTMRSTI